jgi:hypothetical protein
METKLLKFIEKAKIKHSNKYDYSKVNYINSRTKIKIVCPIHGEFEQILNNHLTGSGCNECNNNNKKAKISFIEKAKIKHSNKYDYSLVNYANNKTKIKIVCPIHGEFNQIPNDHLTGNGCSLCGNKNLNKELFIEKARLIHGDKYDYSKIYYLNNKIKIKIVCPIHGEFEQRADHHLQGVSCPICKESKGEREITLYLTENNINFIRQRRFTDCRDKKPLPFDFFIEKYNTCIEFNGKQHYISVPYWGGDENFKKQQKRDKIKLEYCMKNNIHLIIINDVKEINKKLEWVIQQKN